MDNEDLEKTRALNELNVLFDDNNVSDEEIDIPDDINKEENKEELFKDLTSNEDDNNKKDDKKKKKKLDIKKMWNKLSKKQKIITIVVSSIILILIITLIIVLVTKKKEEVVNDDPKNDVVLESDNYVYQNGSITMIDKNGNSLGTYECENKNENKCYVAYLLNTEDPFETPINKYSNDEIIKPRSNFYFNRYVFIYDNDSENDSKIKLYDMNDNKVLNEYYGVKSYDVENKNVIVLKDEKDNYGLFEFSSSGLNTLIDFKYQFMGMISKDKDDKIVIKDSRGYYLADYSGNVKTKAFNGEIIDYNDTYVLVKNNSNKYTVYNYTGEEFNKNYDYIRLLSNDYVAVVTDKNLFIRGYSDNKYNEEGIEITNTDYRKVNFFDDNKKLINSSFAFETELHDKTLTIKLKNSDNTTRDEKINLSEGDVSAKLDYYSYYNGKLYFYEDQEKTKLFGTYECNNKNNITNDTLNNCYVAKDTAFNDSYINPYIAKDSVVAIYNKRFVFIFDSPELKNDSNIEIKFYDLKQNKVLGTYSAVDANMAQSVPSLTLVDTNNTNIIGRFKSGKFGVISINNKDATILHEFTYNYIERAGNDFIVQLKDNNWQIIYGSNGYTSSEFPGRIKNYANGYVVVRNSDKDYLYKGDVSLVLSNGTNFDYIDISNKEVFGGVSNGTLNIYKYDGEKVNTDTISLKSNKYYNTSTPAFKISLSDGGQKVNVNVYNDDGTLSTTKSYSLVSEDNNKQDDNKDNNEKNKDNSKENNENKGDNE